MLLLLISNYVQSMSQNNRLRIDTSTEQDNRLSFVLSNRQSSVKHQVSQISNQATPSTRKNLHNRVQSLHLDKSYYSSARNKDGSLPRLKSIASSRLASNLPMNKAAMVSLDNSLNKQAGYLLDKSTAAEHVSTVSESKSGKSRDPVSLIEFRKPEKSSSSSSRIDNAASGR